MARKKRRKRAKQIPVKVQKYEIIVRPKYELIPLNREIRQADILPLKDFFYYDNEPEKPLFDMTDSRPQFVFFEVLDVSKEPTTDLRVLLIPKWKRNYQYLKYRYRLLQRNISEDYFDPTFARICTDALSLACRWFLIYYRKLTNDLCLWVEYFVRYTYRHFIGDQYRILQLIMLVGMTFLCCFSYPYVAEIYGDSHTIEELGYSFNTKEEVRYELGEPVILDPIYFLEEDSLDYANKVEIRSDLLTNDHFRYNEETQSVRKYELTLLPTGEYMVELKHGDQVRTTKIIVEDTTPPDLSECDLFHSRLIRVHKNTPFINIRGMLVSSIKDASLLETRDLDLGSLHIIADTRKIDTSKTGEYTLKIVVEDKYGNTTDPLPVKVLVVD